MADIDRAARAFASSLLARGIGPGDVVLFQLPNWVEAGIVFWGASYVGAVVVPVVHFYGPKELAYIVGATQPKIVVTADRFGRLEYLEPYEALLSGGAAEWLVVGDTPATELPAGRGTLRCAARRRSDRGAGAGRPGLAGAHRLHVRHDPRSEGRHPFASHDRLRGPAAEHARPSGPATIVGRAARPLHRDAAVAAVSRCIGNNPVHLVDVWDPGEVLRLMLAEDLGMGGGSTYFLTSLLDHPDFTAEHLARHAGRRAGRLERAGRGHRTGLAAGHRGVPVLREHRAAVGDRAASSTSRR